MVVGKDSHSLIHESLHAALGSRNWGFSAVLSRQIVLRKFGLLALSAALTYSNSQEPNWQSL